MAILDFTDVKNMTEGKEGEGREGGVQARFFMWMNTFIGELENHYCSSKFNV